MREYRRLLELAALSSAVALAAAACAPEPGEEIAAAIKQNGSPIVRDVVYKHGNLLDPPEILVYLQAGTTQVQADAFWCSVVVSAGGEAESGPRAVTLWSDGGDEMLSAPSECGEGAAGHRGYPQRRRLTAGSSMATGPRTRGRA